MESWAPHFLHIWYPYKPSSNLHFNSLKSQVACSGVNGLVPSLCIRSLQLVPSLCIKSLQLVPSLSIKSLKTLRLENQPGTLPHYQMPTTVSAENQSMVWGVIIEPSNIIFKLFAHLEKNSLPPFSKSESNMILMAWKPLAMLLSLLMIIWGGGAQVLKIR